LYIDDQIVFSYNHYLEISNSNLDLQLITYTGFKFLLTQNFFCKSLMVRQFMFSNIYCIRVTQKHLQL